MRTTRPKLTVAVLALVTAVLGRVVWIDSRAAEAHDGPDRYELKAELQSSARGASRTNALTRHLSGLSAGQVQANAARVTNRLAVLREKLEDKWFAALLNLNGPSPLSIARRFATWDDLVGFINTNKAVVEVWADPGGDDFRNARRLTGVEWQQLQGEDQAPSTFLTLTGRNTESGQVQVYKVELAFNAAAQAAAELQESRHAGSSRGLVQPAPAPLVAALHLEGAAVPGSDWVGSAQWPKLVTEGGLVEELIAGPPLPTDQSEPKVRTGSPALKGEYDHLLGDLLEWQHYLQKKSLGLPMAESELLQTAQALEDLAAKGVWIDDADALLAVDALQSSFVYRRYVQGEPRVVRVTRVPSRAELVDKVACAEVARRKERREQVALSQGHGVALIHRAQEVDGRTEVGPLVLSEDTPASIQALLDLLDRLPVTNRLKPRLDNCASTLIEADFDGRGTRDRFFLTLEFPPGKAIHRERINPLTGESEVLVEQDGLLTSVITDARITEIDYDVEREETASRTYTNTGSRKAPKKSSLLEETRTLEIWQRNPSEASVDPSTPVIAKSRMNHVTGETVHEIYGLFQAPVATVDAQFITYRQFNPFGILRSAAVFENGRTDHDFERPLPAKLADPVVGRQRFELVSTLNGVQLARVRDLKAQGYRTALRSKDLVKNTTTIETFDNAQHGRKIAESYTEQLDGTNTLGVNVAFEYRDDFFSGQIPFRVSERSASSGKQLSQVETKRYDPLLRRRVGVELDPTGKAVTNVWDARWSRPVEIKTPGRKTVFVFNHDETQVSGVTTITSSGEEACRFNGRFDPRAQRWLIQRVNWYGPGITNDAQFVTLSSSGRVLSIQTGERRERRIVYKDGLETGTVLYARGSASGRFDLLQEREDDCEWNGGKRTARVQSYVGGQPYASFRRVTDLEGRTVLEELQQGPGFVLKTSFIYDGWSSRPLKAETLQNGHRRCTRQWGPAERRSDGTYLLRVKSVPAWGLTRTETFRLGDVSGRPLSLTLETGDSLRVTEWFDGTEIPKRFELCDPHGHPKERFTRRLNAGTEGTIPCDVLEHEKLGFWGTAALVETKNLIRGTDVAVSATTAAEKLFFDLSQPYELPAYAVARDGGYGRTVVVQGDTKEHVLTLFRERLENRPKTAGRKPSSTEPRLVLESISFGHSGSDLASRRTFDRAGNLLEERIAALSPLPQSVPQDAGKLWKAFSQAALSERFHCRYQPGWFAENGTAAGAGRTLTFSPTRPAPGTMSFAVNQDSRREFVTEVEEIKPAPASPQGSALMHHLFRRLHSPVQKEFNPSLPGCTNIWTSWIATELSPAGDRLFDSKLTYDAQQRLSISKRIDPQSASGLIAPVVYQLPEPDPRRWKDFNLVRGTNAFALDWAKGTNLEGCDFVYFYLQSSNRGPWTALFRSASGRDVRVSPKTSVVKPGEAPAAPIGQFEPCPWPRQFPAASGAVARAPQWPVARDNVILISVADLARAGLDIAHVSSAALQVESGTVGKGSVSAVARLVRESRVRRE